MRRTFRIAMSGGIVAACLAVAGPASAKTVCSSGCLTNSIQAALTAASPGATITIGTGNYYENLVVTKPVTLVGSGVETVIYPNTSHPGCLSESSLCGGLASNIILVEASNVTIKSLRLEGNNPTLSSGVVRGGVDIDARNGIITNHVAGTYNNLNVSKVKVSDVYLRGIYASSGGTFNFNHDTVENVQGEGASIAMFNFGGSGRMEANKVTNANDAISANWSTGTEFLTNVIVKSGSGIHTDNNEGGLADVIRGNNVRECTIDGYGIWVFAPYVSATVESNKIYGCSVGLAAFGGAVLGEGPTFRSNTVNGTGAATTGTTYGAYLTTDQLAYGFGNLTATLTKNKFSHFNTGMFVTQTNGGQATVTASPENSFWANQTGADGEPGTTVNAKEDWWGCTKGPNKGGTCNTALGTVTYTPFLAYKPL